MYNEQQLEKWIERQIKAMTPKQRHILKLLTVQPEHWFTRKELAQHLGHKYLQRHDIESLQKLEDQWFVEVNKERVLDAMMRRGHERPPHYKGKNIAYQSRYYSYRVSQNHVRIFEKILLRRPANPRPKKQPQQPGKVIYDSPWQRLKDKLGF